MDKEKFLSSLREMMKIYRDRENELWKGLNSCADISDHTEYARYETKADLLEELIEDIEDGDYDEESFVRNIET